MGVAVALIRRIVLARGDVQTGRSGLTGCPALFEVFITKADTGHFLVMHTVIGVGVGVGIGGGGVFRRDRVEGLFRIRCL